MMQISVLLAGFLFGVAAFAASTASPSSVPKGGKANKEAPSADSTQIGPSEESVASPFQEYGEFDSSEDEAEDEKFFQYGRFFGVGVGAGYSTALGNAGKLYQGGFPTVNGRLNYWFDFQFAFQLSVENSKHKYDVYPDGITDVNLFRVLFNVKYYIDTHDLAAPITFVGPHLIFGGGFYQRTDNIGSGSTSLTAVRSTESQSTFGFNGGLGFELTIKPKKIYLQLESLMHFVQFGDQYDDRFKNSGIPDRSGPWITSQVAVLWTW